MRGNKRHVDASKLDRMHSAAFARGGKGGRTKMFDEQSAGPARSGHSGKVETAAPGPAFAKGGQLASKPRSAKPAVPGRTSSR